MLNAAEAAALGVGEAHGSVYAGTARRRRTLKKGCYLDCHPGISAGILGR
jgi:hypothetical protein